MAKKQAVTYTPGQRVEFVSGLFKGRTGTVQFVGETGRVFVNLNGTAAGPNGKRTKLKGTFAEPSEITPAN